MADSQYQICRTSSKVYLSISGVCLDIDRITRTLAVAPTKSHRAGDRDALGGKYNDDLWLLESPLPPEDVLDAHLGWIKERIAPHCAFIRSLMQTAKVTLSCDVLSETDQCGFDISPETLDAFVGLGIPLEVTAHL